MTAEDAFDATISTTEWTVFIDSIDHVLRAGRLEAAVPTHDMGEGAAIEQDKKNEEAREYVVEKRSHMFIDQTPAPAIPSLLVCGLVYV